MRHPQHDAVADVLIKTIVSFAYGGLDVDKDRIRIDLDAKSIVNLRTMLLLADAFGTTDISLTPREPHKEWSEVTEDPSSPEYLTIRGWCL